VIKKLPDQSVREYIFVISTLASFLGVRVVVVVEVVVVVDVVVVVVLGSGSQGFLIYTT
jgi:hypothetical protein